MKTAKVVSKNFDVKDSHKLDIALKHGAYDSLRKIFSMTPYETLEYIEKSGLRGKSGGAVPTTAKWRLMPKDSDKPSHLVVNADESEPGTFKDKYIIANDPHLLIEGAIIASYVMEAQCSYIYIRGEYPYQHDILQNAIMEAYEGGFLGKNILDSNYSLDLTLHRGGGAYICGEQSALIKSMEGERGHPMLKPPHFECSYLFGEPVTVNNVETISSLPFIINNGFEAYKSLGTKQSCGAALFGISGHINNPTVCELEFGMNVVEFIETIGGGIKDNKKLKAFIPGGVSMPILTAKEVEDGLELSHESMRKVNTFLGTGGMVIMNEDTYMPKVLKVLMNFYDHESCGQCTPCREGTSWANRILKKILDNNGTKKDFEVLYKLSHTIQTGPICLLGTSAGWVLSNILKKFPDEFHKLCK